MNLTGATQDIATDALAVNLLKHDQQHWGNTFQVIGSRLGFIVGGRRRTLVLRLVNMATHFFAISNHSIFKYSTSLVI